MYLKDQLSDKASWYEIKIIFKRKLMVVQKMLGYITFYVFFEYMTLVIDT